MSKQKKANRGTVKPARKPKLAPEQQVGNLDAFVEVFNKARNEPRTVISQPDRSFWPEPNGCVRGPEEDEDAFMRRVRANAEPLKEMMLRNKHNATTVEARTDAELAIESMETPGETFQRLQQEKRWDEEDERREREEQRQAAAEARRKGGASVSKPVSLTFAVVDRMVELLRDLDRACTPPPLRPLKERDRERWRRALEEAKEERAAAVRKARAGAIHCLGGRPVRETQAEARARCKRAGRQVLETAENKYRRTDPTLWAETKERQKKAKALAAELAESFVWHGPALNRLSRLAKERAELYACAATPQGRGDDGLRAAIVADLASVRLKLEEAARTPPATPQAIADSVRHFYALLADHVAAVDDHLKRAGNPLLKPHLPTAAWRVAAIRCALQAVPCDGLAGRGDPLAGILPGPVKVLEVLPWIMHVAGGSTSHILTSCTDLAQLLPAVEAWAKGEAEAPADLISGWHEARQRLTRGVEEALAGLPAMVAQASGLPRQEDEKKDAVEPQADKPGMAATTADVYDPDAYQPVKEFMDQLAKKQGGVDYNAWTAIKRRNPWIRFDDKAPDNRPRIHRADAAKLLDRLDVNTWELLDEGEHPSIADEALDEQIADAIATRRTIREVKRRKGG